MAFRNRRAFSAGLLFLAVAVLFLALSAGLERGTIARMGPGFFPTALSLLLGAIGIAVIVGALRPAAAVEPLAAWDWRSLGWIVGAIVLFAALLAPLGFVGATAVLVVTAARSHPGFTWKGALGTTAVLTLLVLVLFDGLIDLRLPLWPAGLG